MFGKEIAFTFGSHPTPDLSQRWSARLVFPADVGKDGVLPIFIVDGNGEAVAEAVFEFAGKNIKVKDGKASITYREFLDGKSSVPLWLHRKGMKPIPGGLTFA